MKWTSLNDLREKYLSFFESKGHLRLASFSLVPNNDKSLLLINSGMAPMKKFFTGEEEPPRRRVTTCQKCIRTPDLERVGHTARHGTYFEMLGNFSFGDYFKNEAIEWAWEFLTGWLEIPADRLRPSIYENDDEAFEIWNKKIGVPAERIVRLGKADNFWEHGSGPCGPCSEIYFDRGERYGCGSPDCKPGCDCDRFMEIWNNVFSQFNNDGNGNYTELENKNIDTGMGLERLACVMQGVDNLFEVDTVRKILDTVCKIAGKKYGEDARDDVSIRVVTDHIRSATFMICDGVIPSNEGRGYVLRRILRRACRHGKLLGINRAFLAELCRAVIGENISAYPELADKQDYIIRVIENEEERFDATIDAGLNILTNLIRDSIARGENTISGEEVFKLYDTFGYPIDLTREIASENNMGIDEETFTRLMLAQRERARSARGNVSGWDAGSMKFISELPKTEFVGYELFEADAKVLAIIAENEDGVQSVTEASEGDLTIVLDRTPFYGESGGQVGDVGVIIDNDLVINVSDTKKSEGVFLHICTLANGVVRVGDTVKAQINATRRKAIMRAHSSAHLLQAALRSVLGNHVEQAGSYVEDDHMRFDFAHFAPMTKEELDTVERLVNSHILLGEEITVAEMPIAEAKKLGAMALFGEKYGDVVRVVRMGSFSTELCGGTHIDNTGKLGLFKITSESSVAAGVRRIEARTGFGVLGIIADTQRLINETAAELKANNPSDIAKRAGQLQSEIKELRREMDILSEKLSQMKLGEIMSSAKSAGKLRVLTARLDMRADSARALGDKIKAENPDMVAVLAIVNDGKLNFITVCGKDAVAMGAHAGKILGEVAKVCDGKGGGRPDSAMSGGKDLGRIDEALALAERLVAEI